MMFINPTDTTKAVERALQAGLIPYVQGNPGIGKSVINHAICDRYNLKLIDFRLATADPTDMQGFPDKILGKNGKSNRMAYAPPEDIPLEEDEVPQGYDGWYLFFDELSQAFPSIQNAAYKIFLDKMVGQKKIHSKVVMAAAGNLDTDGANTHRMSTALQSRVSHLFMNVSNDDWQAHAAENQFDYRVRAFLKWKPKLLHTFDANRQAESPEPTFGCPRTWEMGSKHLKTRPNDLDNVDLALLAGTVGTGPATEFKGYAAIYDKVPSYDELCRNPTGISMPDEPSVLHALSSLVAHPQHLDTLDKAMPFLDRMPVEFQVWAIRDAVKIRPSLLHNACLDDWKDKYADRLFT